MAFLLQSPTLAVLVFAIFCISLVNCELSEEKIAELTEKLLPTISECGSEYGLSLEKLAEFKLKQKQVEDSNKCFFACVYKKIGLLDSQGLYSEETALKHIAEHADESHAEEIKANAKACTSVNKETVSDGAAGCDRAKLLYDCVIKSSSLFGVDF